MNPIISINNISKRYGQQTALKDLSLFIDRNEVFGMIGPDGAGKTTLFRILSTLILADSGTITIDSLDVVRDYKKIRTKLGYMPGRFSLYQDLTIEENINFYASVFGSTINDNFSLIKDIYVQLEPFKKRRAGKLSGGMKQKLALCCSLIHRPDILILDEPTTGIDPVSRNELWDILTQLKKENITVVVSTPYMDEASRCDRIAMISQGELLKVDTPQRIVADYSGNLWQIKDENMYGLLLCLKRNNDVEICYPFGEYHHLIIKNERKEEIIKYLASNGFDKVELNAISPTIEDCYIKMTAK